MIYAFITSTGEISQIIQSDSTDLFTVGEYYNGLQVQTLSEHPEDISTYLYVRGEWVTREPRPSILHHWKDNQWAVNLGLVLEHLRAQRNAKLAVCDWTIMPDSPLSAEKQAEWASYRQALRDVPQNNLNITHINEVVWPTPPA